MERSAVAENPYSFNMAEVLISNAPSASLQQQGEEPHANRPSSLARSLSFKYYIHDSVLTLRFQLIGDLRTGQLAELNGSWETARTTLDLRRFVLDVRQLYSTDDEGRQWLRKMRDEGAAFEPANFWEAGKAPVRSDNIPEEEETLQLSLMGRVMSIIRGGSKANLR